RQGEVGEREARRGEPPGLGADEHGEQVCRPFELRAKRRDARARLLELRLQRPYLVVRCGAQRNASPGDVELLALQPGERLGGVDLPGDAGLRDGGGRDVAGDRKARGFELEPPVVDLRRERLERSLIAAGEVEVVRDTCRYTVQIEGSAALRCALRWTERRCVVPLALCTDFQVRLRVLDGTRAGGERLACLPQAGARSVERGAGNERLVDQRVESRGAELAPPLRRGLRGREMLRRAEPRVGRRR